MRRLLVLPPVLVVLLCGFLAVSEDAERTVTVNGIRMGVDSEGQTRLVLDLDGRPSYLVGPVLDDGPEIAVHVEGGLFALTAAGSGTKRGIGVIEEVSYGPSTVRLDLTEAALPARVFVLPPAGKVDHFRLVIDLDAVSERAFVDAAEQFTRPVEAPLPAVPADEAVADAPALAGERAVAPPSLKPVRAPVLASPLPDIPDAVEVGAPLRARPLIVLDPGHGGDEPGTVGLGGTTEDSLTLIYAKALEKTLEGRGYDVLLTRETDTYVPHDDRIGLARDRNADLFMSIHADAHEDRSLRGASVYTLAERRSKKLENEIRNQGSFVLYDVEVSSEDEVGDILLDLAQSATRHNSDRLANALIENMQPVMPLLKNPKRRGALLVLLSPDVPAVLVELAFLSNAQDEANLTSSLWQRKAVDAIADGVDDYFAEAGFEARLAGRSANSG